MSITVSLFANLGTHRLFKILRFSGKRLVFLRQKLLLNKEHDQQVDNGKCTKTLVVKNDQSINNRLNLEEFSSLLSLVPNLEVFNFSNSHHFDYYMNNLCYQNHYLTRIHKIHPKQFARNIIDVSTTYFKACLYFHQTLTQLEVYLHSSTYNNPEHFYTLLSLFKNLTYLSITETDDNSSSLFRVLHNLHNLTTLKYSSSGQTSASAVELMDSTTLTSYSKNLKSLRLSISSLTASCIQYIVSCTPYTLYNITIQINEGLCSWIQETDADTVNTFAKRLILAKRVLIACRNRPTILPNVGRNTMNVYYESIDKLKGNKDITDCCVVIDEEHGNDISIELTNCKRMCIRHPYCKRLFDAENMVSSKGGDIVQSLQIHTFDSTSTTLEEMLNYALKSYKYLEHLKIIHLNYTGDSSFMNIDMVNDRGSQETKIQLIGFLSSWLYHDEVLSTCLPNVVSVTCTSSHYWNVEEYGTTWYITPEFDLTCYRDLKSFNLDVKHLINNKHIMLFKIIYPGNTVEEVFCQLKCNYDRSVKYEFVPVTEDQFKKYDYEFKKHDYSLDYYDPDSLGKTIIICNKSTKIVIQDKDDIIAQLCTDQDT